MNGPQQPCIRCQRDVDEHSGHWRKLRLHEDRAPLTVFLCGPCDLGERYIFPHIFNIKCDRCDDGAVRQRKLPTPEEFKEWGRGLPGKPDLGRCVKCENLCASCGTEIESPSPDWTPVAEAGVCSSICAVLAALGPAARDL